MADVFPGNFRTSYYKVEIRLACGCLIRKRVVPGGPGAFYPCIYGLGHGYNVIWASWTDTTTGVTRDNPKAVGT